MREDTRAKEREETACSTYSHPFWSPELIHALGTAPSLFDPRPALTPASRRQDWRARVGAWRCTSGAGPRRRPEGAAPLPPPLSGMAVSPAWAHPPASHDTEAEGGESLGEVT